MDTNEDVSCSDKAQNIAEGDDTFVSSKLSENLQAMLSESLVKNSQERPK